MSIETKTFIGQCLNNRNILADTLVVPQDFSLPEERTVFNAILKIHRAGHTPDVVSVASEAGILVSSLFDMQNYGQITANWRYFEEAVIEQSMQYQIKLAAERILKTPYMTAQDMIDEFSKVSEARSKYQITSNVEGMDEVLKIIKERKELGGKLVGVTTGIDALDRIIYGFQKRRLYYIGARPSMGKTMLLLNFLAECNVPAGFISCESSRIELNMRMVAHESRIDSEAIALGYLKDGGLQRVETATDGCKRNMVYAIYDEPNIELGTLLDKAWYMKRTLGIQILFVDYLQAINLSGGGKKYEQVQEISSKLKQLANNLDIPVVVSAQLRRDAQDERPKLSDFSDSTQIERDADVAVFIHRDKWTEKPDAKNKDTWVDREQMYLLVEKNRDGKQADVKVNFSPDIMRISDY